METGAKLDTGQKEHVLEPSAVTGNNTGINMRVGQKYCIMF